MFGCILVSKVLKIKLKTGNQKIIPKSSLYNDAGSKNYDDKIKVFVHDITAQVRMYVYIHVEAMSYQSYSIFLLW